jgi:hypothetical protein
MVRAVYLSMCTCCCLAHVSEDRLADMALLGLGCVHPLALSCKQLCIAWRIFSQANNLTCCLVYFSQQSRGVCLFVSPSPHACTCCPSVACGSSASLRAQCESCGSSASLRVQCESCGSSASLTFLTTAGQCASSWISCSPLGCSAALARSLSVGIACCLVYLSRLRRPQVRTPMHALDDPVTPLGRYLSDAGCVLEWPCSRMSCTLLSGSSANDPLRCQQQSAPCMSYLSRCVFPSVPTSCILLLTPSHFTDVVARLTSDGF